MYIRHFVPGFAQGTEVAGVEHVWSLISADLTGELKPQKSNTLRIYLADKSAGAMSCFSWKTLLHITLALFLAPSRQ